MGKSIGELVLLARQDDQNAINELYNQTFKKAYFVARTAIKSSDGDYSSQIEDILQDAYVKAFSSLDKLEDPEKFQGWLDTIVINRCKDFLKKKKPTLFSDMASENSNDGSTLDFEDSQENDRIEFKPEETVDYGETKRLIAEMLDRMPEDQKMCLLMYYYEEMSVRQIAEVMDCSEGTIKSRLNYARKNLKGQVLELEKKGTKLYCMPLLPFLYWFFREQAAEFIGGTAGTVAAGAAASTAAAGAGQSVSAGSASSVAGQTASGSTAAQAAATSQTASGSAAAQTAATGQATSAGAAGTAGAGTTAASSSAAGAAGAAAKTAAAVAGKASLGLGAKLAMVGVGAAVVVGGGAAAAASGKLPVDLPWEQGIDVSKFELDENGLLPKEAYDNKKNHKAVEAYMNALDDIKNTYNTEYAYVYMADLDQNGVVELLVTGVEDEADDSHILLNYYMNYEEEDQPIKLENPLDSDLITGWAAYAALLPEENELILTYGDFQEVEGFSMKLSDQTLEEAGTIGWAENRPYEQRFTTDQLRQAEDIFKRADYLEKNWDDISQEDMLYPSNIVGLTRMDMDGMMLIGDEYMGIVRPYIPAVDTEFAMEGDGDGTLDTTLLSYADYRSDKNREAVRAYAQELQQRINPSDIRGIWSVDMNQDGIVEFVVQYYEETEGYGIWGDEITKFFSYDGSVSIQTIDSTPSRQPAPYIGVIPEEKKLVLVFSHNADLSMSEFSLYGRRCTETGNYSYNGMYALDPYSYNYLNYEGDNVADIVEKENNEAEAEFNKVILLPKSSDKDFIYLMDAIEGGENSEEGFYYLYPFQGVDYGNIAIEELKANGYWYGPGTIGQ